MSGISDIKTAVEGMNSAFEQFKAHHDEKLAAKDRDIAALRDRLEDLEAKGSSPGRTSGTLNERKAHEEKQFFNGWLRKPLDPIASQHLANFQQMERKDVTIGTGAQGGFALPEELAREIGRLELSFSPVRRLVRVRQVGSNDFKELVSKRGATSGWVAETGTRSATVSPLLRERAPTMGELYAYPVASNWALDDLMFDPAQWLAEEVAQKFAQEEGLAVISGNGTSKPTGLINTPPVTTADFSSPERNASAYQYIASDLTPGGVALLVDSLFDTYFTLNAEYRSRSTWVMSSATAATIRKMKDTTNQYIWQPGLAAGTPDTLLGRPVEIWEQMPAIGAGLFPIAVGDFARGYTLAVRHEIRITVDNITAPGFTKYYVRRREGGIPTDNHAIKFVGVL